MLLSENRLPPRDAVRIEELINYFNYNYPAPGEKFTVHFEQGKCPWAAGHQLLLIGVQGIKVEPARLPPANFVFLIDNSGSMYEEMPLVVKAMTALATQLRPQDRVSLITYGGGAKILLDSVSGSEKARVEKAILELTSGGFTPGAEGILAAYRLAHKNFIPRGNNRVVLITDGDFNVGVSSESELVELVERERSGSVYLTAIGVGSGNYKDNKLKMLANRGNGNYICLDSPREARHALVNEMTGSMFTLGRDVKFQVEFNPSLIHAYRLLGYELRRLDDRDFNDDTVDSGEIGVGHQVTALYELVPTDAPEKVRCAIGGGDKLKYSAPRPVAAKGSGDVLTFKLRYQETDGKAPSVLREFVLRGDAPATDNWRWAGAVAEFGLLLRRSKYQGTANYDALRRRAAAALGDDPDAGRAEFLTLTTAARDLDRRR